MTKYNVQITKDAEIDMENIYNYIAEELLEPETAMAQYDRIADAILSLEFMPQRIKPVDFEPEHSRKVRRLLIDNYSVFYVIRELDVIVFSVLYSASDLENRLK